MDNAINFDLLGLGGKWNSLDWSIEQFLKHIDEVEDLFASRDSHLMAEVVDLMAIGSHLIECGVFPHEVKKYTSFWEKMPSNNLPISLIASRRRKFIEKSKLD